MRTLAEGRASPPPPAWRPTKLTFRARCQPHLLTQAFASKGSSHRTDLSFEGDPLLLTSHFALLHLAFELLHPEDGGAVLMGRHQAPVFTSDLSPLQQILTSNVKNPHVTAQLALSQEIPHWVLKKFIFPFFSLFFRKPEDSLPKQYPRVNALQGNPGSWTHERLPALERPCSGGNLAGPKSSLIILSSRKKTKQNPTKKPKKTTFCL